MANKEFGTIYIGVTNDIDRRVYEHKQGVGSKFVAKYKLHKLVYLEEYGDILEARQRERNLKHWNRDWKLKLITDFNPNWKDLYDVD